MIKDAIKDIEKVSCVRFKEGSNSDNHHIRIDNVPDIGCRADVGYVRLVGQELNLNDYCMIKGGIIHELLHSLGFYHQHNAPNRDQYLKIHFENVLPGFEKQFDKLSVSDVTDYNLGFDYKSVMQYEPNAFSANDKPTMTALRPGAENMGDLSGLSAIDIKKIKRAYKC